MVSRWPQDGPKFASRSPRWPKMSQEGPKFASTFLSCPQDGPRWPQDGPKFAQDVITVVCQFLPLLRRGPLARRFSAVGLWPGDSVLCVCASVCVCVCVSVTVSYFSATVRLETLRPTPLESPRCPVSLKCLYFFHISSM